MKWAAATVARQRERDRRAAQVRYAVERGLNLKRAAGLAGVSYRSARRYMAEAR